MMEVRLLFAIWLTACGGGTDAAPDAGSEDAQQQVLSECAVGQFAVGFELDGTLRCEAINLAAKAALTENCSFYFGWSDGCDGCSTLPAEWGRISGSSCELGEGPNNTCVDTDLGGVSVPLFGLNIDGNADGNDTFYIGLVCTPVEDEPTVGACAVGSYLVALDEGESTCVTARGAISEYLESSCDVFFGWNDNCDGCTSAPAKWGRTGSTECTVGAGIDNTCGSFRLGGEAVFTLGVNTDGNVNGDDAFYFGFQCNGATVSESTSAARCPPGELIVALDSGGVRCASPIPAAERVVQEDCYVYGGWQDSCTGCETPPTKWGRVSHATCENGTGVDNTCVSTPLDGTSVQLLGINTDGEVGADDKFYLGLACPAEN